MMGSEPCVAWRERLVDYADGELDAGQAAAVEAHLHDCRACRDLLAALCTSLTVARQVWADAAAEIPTAGSPRARRARWARRVLWTSGVAAAAVSAAILYSIADWNAGAPVTSAEVLAVVRETSQAEQLLATAHMLAAAPGGARYAAESYRFIVETYPQSPAAAEAQRALRGQERG